MAAIPAQVFLICPRCKIRRSMVSSDGRVLYRCSGCEWYFTLSTQAPTNTISGSTVVGATALPVASGGASFTSGMLILVDTGTAAEVVTSGVGTGTSIPCSALIKAHGAVAIGQLLISSTYAAIGEEAVPANPGWGF